MTLTPGNYWVVGGRREGGRLEGKGYQQSAMPSKQGTAGMNGGMGDEGGGAAPANSTQRQQGRSRDTNGNARQLSSASPQSRGMPNGEPALAHLVASTGVDNIESGQRMAGRATDYTVTGTTELLGLLVHLPTYLHSRHGVHWCVHAVCAASVRGRPMESGNSRFHTQHGKVSVAVCINSYR